MSKKKQRKLAALAAAELQSDKPSTKKRGKGSTPGTLHLINWLVVLVLILPFLITDKISDPVVTIRFLFLCGFLFLLLVIQLFRKQPLSLPNSRLLQIIVGLVIAFGVWQVISLNNAINYREGYFELARYWLGALLLFIVTIIISKEENLFIRVCNALVIVALLQGLVGIIQFYELGFNELPGANEKPYGLMGNRNLFGSAQALVLPFVVFALYKGTTFWKYISSFTIVILLFSVFLSQTRAAWLSVILFIIVVLLFIILFVPAKRKKWLSVSGILLIAFAALISIVLLADTEGNLATSVKERAATLTGTTSTATAATSTITDRLQIWKQTTRLIKDHPITGVGPGNWKLGILAYGTKGLAWEYGKYSPDRVHNVYLQQAAETGIPGLLLYAGIWILIAIAGFKVIKKTDAEEIKILVLLMLAGLVVFATDAMFSFPTERMEHTLYIMLMGGTLLGCYARIKASSSKIWVIKKPMLIAGLSIIAFAFFIGMKRYDVDLYLSRAKVYENERRYTEMLTEVNKGKNNFVTLGAETGIPLQLKTAIALKELKRYDEALKEIAIAKKYNPYSANVYSTEGTIYTDMGQFARAIESYEKGLSIVPQHDIILKNLSVNYFNVENYKGCIDVLNKVQINGDEYLLSLLAEAKRRLALQVPDKN